LIESAQGPEVSGVARSAIRLEEKDLAHLRVAVKRMTGAEIGRVTVQPEYRVYADGTNYRVENHKRSDPTRTFANPVSGQAVEAVRRLLGQLRTATVEGMLQSVQAQGPKGLGFACYGYQLQYEVQRALVVLVARGEARLHKEGRHFVYTVA
jgi:hypothetical protein